MDDELNFDKFHEKDDQLFQVMQNIKTTKEIVTMGATPGPLAETLAEEMPDVKYAASVFEIHLQGKPNLSFEDKKIKANCIFFPIILSTETQTRYSQIKIQLSSQKIWQRNYSIQLQMLQVKR